MRPAIYPGSIRIIRIDGCVFSIHSVLDMLIDHAWQLLPAIVIADYFVAGGKILAHTPHLNYVVMLELVQGLLRPIGADKLNVRVDPGEVLGFVVLAERIRDEQVQGVLLVPELESRSQLEVIGFVWHSHLEGPASEGYFGDMQDGASVAHTLLERPKQVVAGAETLWVGYRRQDVEAVRERLDVALGLRSMVDKRWDCHMGLPIYVWKY